MRKKKRGGVKSGSWQNLGEPLNYNSSLTPVKDRGNEKWVEAF